MTTAPTPDALARRPHPASAEPPIHTTVRDALNYFGTCARCGYPAQASEIVRTFVGGRVEVTIQPTCGLPCGWHGDPRVVRG
ncbi:hypothetical protein [Nocardia wallacei]|uniref:hypothetical protein n=1 Tax=Nocardia wallacei TaxID=480035 RepID=UPI00245555F0|nr:hypothetical protein [Nocardia wallacei]